MISDQEAEGFGPVLSTIFHISLRFLSSRWRLWQALKGSWEGSLCFFSSCCHLCLPLCLGSPHLTGWHQSLVSSCSSRCGWHLIQVEERAGLTRAADEETELESRECLNPSWQASPEVEKHREKKRNTKKTHYNAWNSSTNSALRFYSCKEAFSSQKPEDELITVITVTNLSVSICEVKLLLEGQTLQGGGDFDHSASTRWFWVEWIMLRWTNGLY